MPLLTLALLMMNQRSLSLFLFLSIPFILSAEDLIPMQLADMISCLRNGYSVVTISVRPGDEDFKLLSQMRAIHAGRLHNLYVTNGEDGVPAGKDLTPNQLAGQSRTSAYEVGRMLGAEVRFLVQKDFGGEPDFRLLKILWPADTLERKLMKLLSEAKPDLIVLFADRRGSTEQKTVAYLAQRVQRVAGKLKSVGHLGSRWVCGKVYIGGPIAVKAKKGLLASRHGTENDERWSAADWESVYRQNHIALDQFNHRRRIGYRAMNGGAAPIDMKNVFGNLKSTHSAVLSSLGKSVRAFADLAEKTGMAKDSVSKEYLNSEAVQLLTDIDRQATRLQYQLTPADAELLNRWRETVTRIRNMAYGIRINIRQSETVLTFAQLSYLTADTIMGFPPEGKIEFFVPQRAHKWILNEQMSDRVLLGKDPIRIISPIKAGEVTYPISQMGLRSETYDIRMRAYVLCTAPTREHSFIVESNVSFHFAPKFTVEPLDLIVKLGVGEIIPVRLTSHSRDGVYGSVSVVDSSVQSSTFKFHFRGKEDFVTDTLRITRVPEVDETMLIPIGIDGIVESAVGARPLRVRYDSMSTIYVATAYEHSSLTQALSRVGYRVEGVKDSIQLRSLPSKSIIVVDQFCLPAANILGNNVEVLLQLVNEGSKVVFLNQSVERWNTIPDLVGSIRLEAYDELALPRETRIVRDAPKLNEPNTVVVGDFFGWIGKSLWDVAVPQNETVESDGIRFEWQKRSCFPVSTWRHGRGSITYVSLGLKAQLRNIHAGAFRLLANLLTD